MATQDTAVANGFAAAERRLETLSVLCGICSGRIEALRQDLRQIRQSVATAQRPKGEGQPGEISPEMLG